MAMEVSELGGTGSLTIEQPWAISTLGTHLHLGSLSVIQKESNEIVATFGGRDYHFHLGDYNYASVDEIETLLVEAKAAFDA